MRSMLSFKVFFFSTRATLSVIFLLRNCGEDCAGNSLFATRGMHNSFIICIIFNVNLNVNFKYQFTKILYTLYMHIWSGMHECVKLINFYKFKRHYIFKIIFKIILKYIYI